MPTKTDKKKDKQKEFQPQAKEKNHNGRNVYGKSLTLSLPQVTKKGLFLQDQKIFQKNDKRENAT